MGARRPRCLDRGEQSFRLFGSPELQPHSRQGEFGIECAVHVALSSQARGSRRELALCTFEVAEPVHQNTSRMRKPGGERIVAGHLGPPRHDLLDDGPRIDVLAQRREHDRLVAAFDQVVDRLGAPQPLVQTLQLLRRAIARDEITTLRLHRAKERQQLRIAVASRVASALGKGDRFADARDRQVDIALSTREVGFRLHARDHRSQIVSLHLCERLLPRLELRSREIDAIAKQLGLDDAARDIRDQIGIAALCRDGAGALQDCVLAAGVAERHVLAGDRQQEVDRDPRIVHELLLDQRQAAIQDLPLRERPVRLAHRAQHQADEAPLGERTFGLEDGRVALAARFDCLPGRADDARDQREQRRRRRADAKPMPLHELGRMR